MTRPPAPPQSLYKPPTPHIVREQPSPSSLAPPPPEQPISCVDAPAWPSALPASTAACPTWIAAGGYRLPGCRCSPGPSSVLPLWRPCRCATAPARCRADAWSSSWVRCAAAAPWRCVCAAAPPRPPSLWSSATGGGGDGGGGAAKRRKRRRRTSCATSASSATRRRASAAWMAAVRRGKARRSCAGGGSPDGGAAEPAAPLPASAGGPPRGRPEKAQVSPRRSLPLLGWQKKQVRSPWNGGRSYYRRWHSMGGINQGETWW